MQDLPQLAAPAAQENTRSAPLDSREAEAMRLRAKILGLRIRQSRIAAGRSLDDCAKQLRLPQALITSWEFGEALPSRPQMQLLADYLGLSVSSFSQDGEQAAPPADSGISAGADIALEARRQPEQKVKHKHAEFLALRQRLLGGLIRAARRKQAISAEELSGLSGIESSQLQAYEFGEQVMPMQHLQALAKALELDLADLISSAAQPALNADEKSVKQSVDQCRDQNMRSSEQKTRSIMQLAEAFSALPSEELQRIADALRLISRAKSGSNDG